MNQKGFTLVELIMSVLFIAIIFTTIIAIWAVSSGIFSDTGLDTVAHNEATAYEAIFRSAVLPAESMEIKGDIEEADDFDFLAEHIIFGFNEGNYSVSYFAEKEDYDSRTVLSYNSLDSPDQVQIRFEEVGHRPKIEYRMGKKRDNSGYLVEGGIILENIDISMIDVELGSLELELGNWKDLEEIGFLCFER